MHTACAPVLTRYLTTKVPNAIFAYFTPKRVHKINERHLSFQITHLPQCDFVVLKILFDDIFVLPYQDDFN